MVKGKKQERKQGSAGTSAGGNVRENVMQWLLGDNMDTSTFFETYWEKRPLVVKRNAPDYYGSLFDREKLLSLLKSQTIEFGAGLTIAKHDPAVAKSKDIRTNVGSADWHGELPPALHPTGRATAEKLKQLFATG